MAAAAALAAAALAWPAAQVRLHVEQTSSMAPALNPGDLLVSVLVPAHSVAAGDIVTFADPSRDGVWVTHRTLRIEQVPAGLRLTTRGDANTGQETWDVPADRKVVRMTAAVPFAGTVLHAPRDPHVAVPAVATLGFGCAVFALARPSRPDRARARARR